MSNNPSRLMPSLWGGLFIVVISYVPGLGFINCRCCSGIIGGGLLAVHLYRKKGGHISLNTGIELGLLSGLVATLLGTILLLIVVPYLPEILNQFEEILDQPEMDEIMARIGPELLKRGVSLVLIASSLIINVLCDNRRNYWCVTLEG